MLVWALSWRQCFCLFVCLRQGLALSLRLECSGMITTYCSLNHPDSSNPPTSAPFAPTVAGTTGTHHHSQLIFVFLVETGFPHVGQDGLNLLTSWSACLGLPKCWDYKHEPGQVLFFISDWELGKTGANNGFLSCLKMYLYVYLIIYKADFPGIQV